jgi:hypothetical protein
MLKNKNLAYIAIAIVFLAIAVIFVWNNYQIQVQERPDKPIKIPPKISNNCGMESCSGLNIACGPNVATMCPEMYAVGDNCRQYASCQKIDGQCQLVKDQKFDNCKSCVEECLAKFKSDQIKIFQCEGECK